MIGNDGSPDRPNSVAFALMAKFVIFSAHSPVFETGKGKGVLQAPTDWITVGGKPRSGGTSMLGAGVFPVTVRSMTGRAGSLLTILRLQDFGPTDVGVKRIVSGA